MKRNTATSNKGHHRRSSAVEQLESRWLLAFTGFDDVTGILTVTGTVGDDQIVVNVQDGQLVATLGDQSESHVLVAGMGVKVDGGAGNDRIVLDASLATGNPELAGTISAEVLGGEGSDTLVSGPGDDRLDGGLDNDTFVFNDGWGHDIIKDSNHVGGTDTMDFSAVTVDLFATIGLLNVNGGQNTANHGENDIENLIGGAGNDVFHFQNGGSLQGSIHGGGGINTLDYTEYAEAVSVNLATGTATGVTGGIQGIRNVVGGLGNDTLIGDDANNQINGGAGNDTITGGVGNDSLNGDAGNDSIDGGAGADSVNGGLGDDTINGGTDNDTLTSGGGSDKYVIGPDSGNDTVNEPTPGQGVLDLSQETQPLVVRIGATGITVTRGGTVVATGNSDLGRVIGGAANDLFTFDRGATFGGVLDGGLGINTIDYRKYTTPVNVNLTSSTATATGGIARFDTVLGGAGNDKITGNANKNRLDGNGGKDTIVGGAGNDAINGGDANDVLKGGAGNDNLKGGDGDDKLYGDADIDRLYGGVGNDVLTGGKGGDLLSGDAGNDNLLARDTARDTVKGGSGKDKTKRDAKLDRVSTTEVLA